MLRLVTAYMRARSCGAGGFLVFRVSCRVHLDTGVLTGWQAHTHGLLLPGWRFEAALRHRVA
jgi:hypothetical protein